MFLPRNMLLLYKCELNHHVDLITVYDGLGRGFNSILYLFKFLSSKKQHFADDTGVYNLKYCHQCCFIFECTVALPPHTLSDWCPLASQSTQALKRNPFQRENRK